MTFGSLREAEEQYASLLATHGLTFISGIWAYSAVTGDAQLPSHGIKLHLSVRPSEACHFASVVLPYLESSRTRFKVAINIKTLLTLNRGGFGFTQVGKFMTVYPRPERLLEVAGALDQLTRDFRGPDVPSDFQYSEYSSVYYRHGVISGSEGPSERNPREPLPPHLSNPFAEEGLQPTSSSPLPPSIAVVGLIRQRAKGGVYTVLHRRFPGEVLIMKEARAYGEADLSGNDAHTWLETERLALLRLAGSGFTPELRDAMTLKNSRFLVMTRLPGMSLAHVLLQEPERFAGSEVKLVRQAIELVQNLERRGITWWDISPSNLLIDGGTLSACDFEHAEFSGITSDAATPGFVPTECFTEGKDRFSCEHLKSFAICALLRYLYNPPAFQILATTGVAPELNDAEVATLPSYAIDTLNGTVVSSIVRLASTLDESHSVTASSL